MVQKSIWVRWYPRLIALLFAAIFVFVTVKYMSQIKKEGGNVTQAELSSEDDAEY